MSLSEYNLSDQKHFSKYLYSLRVERGFTNISEYLREYPLPISDVYYRDIEIGRKVVSLEKADDLCKALKADKRSFFFYLLSDLLPSDVVNEVVRPVVGENFDSLEERLILLEDDRKLYREAFAKAKLEESFIPSEQIIAYLNSNLDLMPIIHFLFSTEWTNKREIGVIVERNLIQRSTLDVVLELEKLGIISVERNVIDEGSWIIRRRLTNFRVPHNELGRNFKDSFFLREIDYSVNQSRMKKPLSDSGTFLHSEIVALSKHSLEKIRSRSLALMAEVEAAEEPLSKGLSQMYFFALVLSSRDHYSLHEGEG